MATGEQRWNALAEQVVADAGFDLEDLTVVSAGRRRLVQVIIDGDDGVPLDAAAAVSRALSTAFDAADELDAAGFGGAPYTLEVTSPGIGRPLTTPRHFHRARGRLVALVTVDGGTVEGRLLGVTDSGVDLLTGRNGTEHRHLNFGEIGRAKVQVDFSGPSKAVAVLLAADPRTAHLHLHRDDADAVEADTDTDTDTDTAEEDR